MGRWNSFHNIKHYTSQNITLILFSHLRLGPADSPVFPTKILYLSLPYVLHLVLIIKISDGEHKLSKSRICLLVLVWSIFFTTSRLNNQSFFLCKTSPLCIDLKIKWGLSVHKWNDVKWSVVMWSELTWYMWSDFVLKWSELRWSSWGQKHNAH